VQTAVSVHASQFRRSLYLDGLHQANDTPDMVRLHRVIGHLPMVLHPSPIEALVVGLGGGATAGAVSQYPGVRVQIVELSDGVRRAAPFFSHISYDVLNQPHVRLRVDDGRNFLLLSGERFDVITADIIQPSHAGAGNLYSREYFTLVRRALKDDGLALQWIGHRPEGQYKLIMRTFLDVFPHATLWFDGGLMVGSLKPLKIHASTIGFKRANPQTQAALDQIGLRDFETLTGWYTAGPEQMKRFVGAGTLLTDDRPLVEYHRSLPANDPPVDLSSLRGDPSTIVSR
jgi:spermidine synthase